MYFGLPLSHLHKSVNMPFNSNNNVAIAQLWRAHCNLSPSLVLDPEKAKGFNTTMNGAEEIIGFWP